jgi:hypothetical protein
MLFRTRRLSVAPQSSDLTRNIRSEEGQFSVLHILSTLVLVIVAVGFWLRKRKNAIHIRLMISAFLIDLGLVLYIEFSRKAVQKVVASTSALLWFHAVVSVLVLLCYGIMIQLGRGVLAGHPRARDWHRLLGITFLLLRGLNYVTSYLVT